MLACFLGSIEILGGLAIQWRKTVRAGAIALGAVFLTFALFWIPRILAEPLLYARWGNLFEQSSEVAGALIVYAMAGRRNSGKAPRAAWIGYRIFGVCVISFTLEQLIYLSGTASYVPRWIPPGQMFWAVTTTIALALAAIALLSGRSALSASRWLTVMLIGFGVLVWLPAPFADPHKQINWAGNAQNLGITAAAWIVADFLNKNRRAAGAG